MSDAPDLLSLVLELRPEPGQQPRAGHATRWWGRSAHALLLQTIARKDAALAKDAHDDPDNPRPFTASSLLGYTISEGIQSERTYQLRFTALCQDITAILLEAIHPNGSLAPDSVIELDRQPFRVIASHTQENEHAWAGEATYQSLGAAYLLAAQPPVRRIAFHYASPTTFKEGKKEIPVPLPDLVFGSLLKRWNTFSTITFPDEIRQYAAESLVISQYELRSHNVAKKGDRQLVGGVGLVTYADLNNDRYSLCILHTLAEYARYAGVGASTTQGMGQCRLGSGATM